MNEILRIFNRSDLQH